MVKWFTSPDATPLCFVAYYQLSPMYEYRKLSVADRKAVIAARRDRLLPLHAPPHYPGRRLTYILTAACYEHRELIRPAPRRDELASELLAAPAEIHAWVILPNHYHLLATVDLAAFREWIRVCHSRLATNWNREDSARGRRVWYRFQDRQIRGDGHFYATMNYIHANPVKHGFAKRADDWPWCSFHRYLVDYGRELLVKLWRDYPVDRYGAAWDD
ncbi:MAG: hypothetical protein PCFJNLEI_02007 [Verrucomicrobiae bacterium]|nr:hypothetical protein [Verrucomicrobiae bacterium]